MVGSRTQWNITPSFYVGFDVMYQRLETAFAGSALYTAADRPAARRGTYVDQEPGHGQRHGSRPLGHPALIA